MKKLADKVAVITGGSSGIGLAVAQLFVREGAKVTITGRNQQTLAAAADSIVGEVDTMVSDTSVLADIDRLYASLEAKHGKIDILVLNAGMYLTGGMRTYSEEDYDRTMGVNVKGIFFSVQKALPFLSKGASIILTGSTVAEMGLEGIAAYAASKAAVRSLARSFSAELLPRSIRVNVLSPGPVDTDVFERGGLSPEQIEQVKAGLISATPVSRLASAEEIAKGFLFLASDDSSFMVGSELLVDGGLRTL